MRISGVTPRIPQCSVSRPLLPNLSLITICGISSEMHAGNEDTTAFCLFLFEAIEMYEFYLFVRLCRKF